MNREEQQAREIDSIRRALERKPQPRLNDTDWLHDKIDEPQSRYLPLLYVTLAFAATAGAYLTINARLAKEQPTTYPAPAPTQTVKLTEPPKPVATPAPTPAPQRNLYITTTRPTPAPTPPRPAQTTTHYFPTTVTQTSQASRHAAVARNYLMQQKSIYASAISTEAVPGWDGRYRTIFEQRRTPNYGGSIPTPRRYEVLTEERGGTIIGMDISGGY